MTIAQTRLEDYERDGVVRLRSFLPKKELQDLRTRIDRYVQDVLPTLPTADYTLEPDGKTVRNLWRMHEHDDFFRALARREDFLDLVGPLVRGDPVLWGVETFNKPARVGSAVPPHQDNAYFCRVPPDMLSLWIAIDPCTIENGAVEYLLGSHGELRPHAPSGVKGNSYGLAEVPPPGQFESFIGTLEPGDALVHHCQVIHQSGPNRSERSRRGLVLVYAARHCRVDEEREAEYHRALAATPQNA